MNIVFIGLSLSSSWGNGHATTYRCLLRALHERGHRVLFLERNQPWYAQHRDLPAPDFCELAFYATLEELRTTYTRQVAEADAVVLGSYVNEGVDVAEWMLDTAEGVTAFYDIDTPLTLRQLRHGACTYLCADTIPHFDLYLSFSGGPILGELEQRYGAQRALPLYCSAEPDVATPDVADTNWTLGYLGTYSADRQPLLESLLLEPARRLPKQRFAVTGPMYPAGIQWPANVERRDHLDPSRHGAFYRSQRFTLNLTRDAMREVGYSPSVRLFEAAACGVPIVTDEWAGLESFFTPGREILVARNADEAERILCDVTENERRDITQRARQRLLDQHTPAHRAANLETWLKQAGANSERRALSAEAEL